MRERVRPCSRFRLVDGQPFETGVPRIVARQLPLPKLQALLGVPPPCAPLVCRRRAGGVLPRASDPPPAASSHRAAIDDLVAPTQLQERRRRAGRAAADHYVRLMTDVHGWRLKVLDKEAATHFDRFRHVDVLLLHPVADMPRAEAAVAMVTTSASASSSSSTATTSSLRMAHALEPPAKPDDWVELWSDVKSMKSVARGDPPQNQYVTLELDDFGWIFSPEAHAEVLALEVAPARVDALGVQRDGAFVLVDRAALAAYVVQPGVIRDDLPPVADMGAALRRLHIRMPGASDSTARRPDSLLTVLPMEEVWAAAGIALVVHPEYTDPVAVTLNDDDGLAALLAAPPNAKRARFL